ncbi:DUF655 domain-containing protein [Halorarum salinum]|uniref:DUF655 domain-containing protein n=1 Tax=Halorarum salinum TaxID=2743089 RepID=A0A7D5QH89_9EURY|nr:DUF655 domain-containing protein [Halobaculum salinum]QLG62743.1 DUF655 domain-containing protein [Halobaculum salinum]
MTDEPSTENPPTDADAATADETAGSRGETREAVILDFLPNGDPADNRAPHQKPALAYALDTDDFRLFRLQIVDGADVSIGDGLVVDPEPDPAVVDRMTEIGYDDLTRNAQGELEYAVEELVEREERRFVDFFNDAGPISLRLHQLNLLPGIGKKLRNNILDERKRGPFESFDDVTDRVSGLHHPQDVLVERIMEELRDEDLKYRTFVGRNGGDGG